MTLKYLLQELHFLFLICLYVAMAVCRYVAMAVCRDGCVNFDVLQQYFTAKMMQQNCIASKYFEALFKSYIFPSKRKNISIF